MEQLEKIKKFLQTDFAKQSLESLSVICQMYGDEDVSQTLYYYEGNTYPELYYSPYVGSKSPKEINSGLLKSFLERLYELIQENIVDLFEDEISNYDYFNSVSFTINLNFETKELNLIGYVSVQETEYSSHEFEVRDDNVIESMKELFDNGYNKIKVDFSGGGDSGYIESTGWDADEQVDIPATIEDELYRALESIQSGWEINEGSQGDFLVDCSATKIYVNFGLNYEKDERLGDEFSIDLQY